MNKKFIAVYIAIMVALPLAFLTAKTVTVEKIGKKKSAVTFDHSSHKKMDKCKACHHKGKVTLKCGSCHKGAEGKKALHKNCISQCHKPQKKGPRGCKQCHK